jgi:hypothetical protein
VLLNLLEPGAQVKEGLLVAEVKDYDYTVGALVIGIRDRPVSLLSCGVPYLQLYCALVYLKSAEPEVHSDCRDVVFREAVIREAHKQAGFAYTGVPDEHELEEVIAISCG